MTFLNDSHISGDGKWVDDITKTSELRALKWVKTLSEDESNFTRGDLVQIPPNPSGYRHFLTYKTEKFDRYVELKKHTHKRIKEHIYLCRKHLLFLHPRAFLFPAPYPGGMTPRYTGTTYALYRRCENRCVTCRTTFPVWVRSSHPVIEWDRLN